MSDALNVALRISAIDAFSGVIRRLRSRIAGLGPEAGRVQSDYDKMFKHLSRGFAGLAVGKYIADKMKPGLEAAADLQQSLNSVAMILQGAHPQAAKLADQMERIKRNSISVSAGMKYSATAITDVTRELIQGGVPLAAILDKLDSRGRVTRRGAAFYVEALAETKGMTPAETASDIANVGHAFQLRPDQYGAAADLIAKASVTGSGSLIELFHNLQNVASIAHMANANPGQGLSDLQATLAALKAIAPLGETGGSDLAMVIQSMEGARLRGDKYMKKRGLSFYSNDKFIGIDAAIEHLRAAMAKLPNQQARLVALGRIFQTGGSKAIEQLLAPSMPGVKSYEEVKAAIAQQAGLVQQMHKWEEAFSNQMQIMKSVNQNTLAVLFSPALNPATSLMRGITNWSAGLGKAAAANPAIAKGVTIGAGVLAGSAGAYGIYHLLRSLGPGKRVISALLKNLGKTVGGIAEGKAVQAVTGVTPVFVTNWPAAPAIAASGGSGGAPGTVIAATRASAARRLYMSLSGVTAQSFRLRNGFRGIAGAAAKTVGGLGVAASAGWALGKALDSIPAVHKWLDNEFQKSAAYAAIAHFSGANKNAVGLTAAAQRERDRLVREELMTATGKLTPAGARESTKMRGEIHIRIESDKPVRVPWLRSSDPDIDLFVGHMMQTP